MLLVLLGAFHGLILFAGFVAPYDYRQQHRSFPYAPPTRVHCIDSKGHFHLRPFVYSTKLREGTFDQYTEDRSRVFPIRFFLRDQDSRSIHLLGVESPGRLFLLGTDGYGRDIFSRLLFGGRISVSSGLLGSLIAVSLGTLIGGIAGYYGRWLDDAAMALTEIFLCVPWLYLLLIVRALLPIHIAAIHVFLLLVVVLGAVGWARPARLIRGVVLTTKQRDYVTAARSFGASDLYLLRVHIWPAALGVILTQTAWYVPQFMLAEVTLSFFGLGVGEPFPSWGNMLAALERSYVLESCWWMLAPAVAIVIVFLGYRRILFRYIGPAPQV
jgi:peptide/nickel transport system permease protein